MTNPPLSLPIAEIDESTRMPHAGDTVRVILSQMEYSDIRYTLLEACIFVTNSSKFIRYNDFSVDDSGKSFRYDRLLNVILNGKVIDGPALMAALLEARELRSDENFVDHLENFLMELREQKIWMQTSCLIPDLFKTTWIEQLLFWLQWEGTEENEKPDIANELIELSPSLKAVSVVSNYL